MTSVQPIMTNIRNRFYRHRDASMYDSFSLGVSLGVAESFFIAASSALFCVVFISSAGLAYGVKKYFGYWGFFTFNSALYSFFGQLFVAVVQSPKTAMILSGVYIGFNNLFSGLIIPPQLMLGSMFAATYYVTPGHYVLEGEIVCIMYNDARSVEATPLSDFSNYLFQQGICRNDAGDDTSQACLGTQQDYVNWFFGGEFNPDHIARNIWILFAFLVFSRFMTWLALKFIRFP
jgi:ABC-type multidrug transport system permease subunit